MQESLGTLVLIKPDGVRRKMIGQIIAAIESLGLYISYLKLKHLTQTEAKELYKEHTGKWHFSRNIKHITSGPCVIIRANGKNNAVQMCRTMVNNFREANRDVIKLPANLVHATSNPEKAYDELQSVGINIPELMLT